MTSRSPYPVSIPDEQVILTATEVAALFRVDRTTAIRWARRGRVDAFQTPGGDWRFDRADIEHKLETSR